jgi:hypothetical protein
MADKTKTVMQEKIVRALEPHYEKIEKLSGKQVVVVAHNPGSESTEMLQKIGWQGETLFCLTDEQRQKLAHMCGEEGGLRVSSWFETKRKGAVILFLEEYRILLDRVPKKHAAPHDEIDRALKPHIRDIKKLSSNGDLVIVVIFPHRLPPWSEELLRQFGWKGEALFCLPDEECERLARHWAEKGDHLTAAWISAKRPGRVLAFSGERAGMFEVN